MAPTNNGSFGECGAAGGMCLLRSDTVTWFFHSPIYEHPSLLTEYSGTIAIDGPDPMSQRSAACVRSSTAPAPAPICSGPHHCR
ncbi:hypothetical protein [Nocardia cyriacigeorgica]|uniref:hypothetical protein n=1 Tax=Nocardia cyriacigeorgica TaxID=135487 RepID=UPI002456E49C|nr:hypothetical protein [Nocardia cyriacigeorgica]